MGSGMHTDEVIRSPRQLFAGNVLKNFFFLVMKERLGSQEVGKGRKGGARLSLYLFSSLQRSKRVTS